MKNGDTIQHIGTIINVENGCIVVKIMQASACTTCEAASLCKSSETKEKTIEVFTPQTSEYKVGEVVKVVGSVSMGLKAIVWAYVLPLLLLISLLITVMEFTNHDALAAIVGICSLIPYYIVLYLFRNKISGNFQFNIEKQY